MDTSPSAPTTRQSQYSEHSMPTFQPMEKSISFATSSHCKPTKNWHDHAQSLMNGLVAPLRSLCSTPGVSPRLVMEDSIDNIASESAGPMLEEARLRTECLARDGGRCVITRRFDDDYLDAKSNSSSIFTECAHIIPFSLISWRTESEGDAKDII